MAERVSSQVKATFLTRKPAKDSHLVAFIFFAGLFLTSFFFWQASPEFQNTLMASKQGFFGHFKVWQVFTATFVHSDIKHFLANSVMFTLLVFLIYGYYGTQPLLILLFLLSPLINGLTVASYEPAIYLLGASGAVYAMGAFWLWMYFRIDRRHSLAKRFLRCLGFGLVVFMPSNFEPNVSYTAHFLGFVLGAGYGAFFFNYHQDAFRAAEVVEIDTVTEDPFFFQ